MFSTTAILVFSYTASDEAAVKTFHTAAGKSGNRAIARRFIRQSISTAHRTHLPVFVHYTSPQDPFGPALAEAMEQVYARGYERIIAIGNDCPELDVATLRRTAQQLEQHALVLGPALDGGVYLIGMRADAYRRQDFVQLAWQSAQLQADWLLYASQLSQTTLWLEAHTDIDRPEDFAQWLRSLPYWSPLKKLFLSILASSTQIYDPYPNGRQAAKLCRHTPWRGPPAYL